MLKYLIIPLANDAVSFCHYERKESECELIPLDILKKAVFWAMKENLNVQFVYPDYSIPDEYKIVIDSIDHIDIVSSDCEERLLLQTAEIIVFNRFAAVDGHNFSADQSCVLRISKVELFKHTNKLAELVTMSDSTIVVITDVDSFDGQDFKRYEKLLNDLIPIVRNEYVRGRTTQLNILTDRVLLDAMNNCNAGHESITLAPDGHFYICPAFYLDGSLPVGDIENGLDVKNQQLYRLDHAPICRNCDAYQCRRCVWLNKKTTLEVNTPSHTQCVVAHIERNASRKLLEAIREHGEYLPEKEINGIDYLDPFEKIVK